LYHATCLQWDGSNYADIEQLFADADALLTPYSDDYIIVRFPERIDTIKPGWWVRRGENGDVKCYDDATFRLKYEALEVRDATL
jgi:hypothetical protein